ncbi:zeatin O-glucosyltransferase-like [Argentina anserina]|uniref:zeatin O-glucosyltransferase-like n=1 Tax=Argentina anserina TaxID=57926 RepID=UPI0021768CF7|nr:zeatin O-glucosyltransferase-like [Potentilla anserina]
MAPKHQNNALNEVVVVMVPLPAQGHLNQLLHLSRLISTYNIPVHFVGTPSHNRQAKVRFHGWDQTSDVTNTIHFHDFIIPRVLCPPPNPNALNKFPSHLQPTFEATTHLRHPVAALLRKLASQIRRVVVIHDSLMASVIQDVGSIVNSESYIFHSVSAFTEFYYLWERIGCPPELEGVHVKSKIPDNMPSLKDCFPHEFLNFIDAQYECTVHSSGYIYNASKTIEGEYVDLLNKLGDNNKHWAIGPFNPVPVPEKKEGSNDGKRHACLEWLDEQKPNSVIYVSFGTTTCMNDEQIKELAIGLDQSNQKFIWVLRDADKGNLFMDGDQVRKAELPEGYEKRLKDRGVVVRDWAPQLEILSHKATAWFLSHCGWNSCMESLTLGVPIACWPMHSDQPRNTVLVTKVLKVGVVIRDWERRNELITSSMVSDGVGKLMGSGEVDEIRKKARELSAAVRGSMVDGGGSHVELSSFIAHITR